MKTVAASNGKFTSVETHYPDGRVRKQYYESGRWTDTKPKGLAITHGHWQDKPYIVNIDGGAGQAVKGIGRPQDSDKNHPYWKTPEGKAEQYFSQRMAAAEHGTFTHQDKIKSIAEAARKKALSLNSEAAGINQEIDRINRKRKYTKEDEAKVKELNKKRIEAERESTAFVNEWRKWKEENNVPEPEHFKRVVINL